MKKYYAFYPNQTVCSLFAADTEEEPRYTCAPTLGVRRIANFTIPMPKLQDVQYGEKIDLLIKVRCNEVYQLQTIQCAATEIYALDDSRCTLVRSNYEWKLSFKARHTQPHACLRLDEIHLVHNVFFLLFYRLLLHTPQPPS